MRVRYNKKFEKQLTQIPSKVQERFYERLRLFVFDKFNPILNNHSVDKVFPGCNSINITGDYRAIFYEKADLVIFIKIGTHSELYS